MSSDPGQPYSVRVGEFEGPLDLLLHLVRRHEFDVEEIPLARITGEYLETLEFMAGLDLELAGEFLEVAASLLRLKARALLPRQEVPQDPEAAAAEEAALLQQLVEHQVVRIAAQRLRRREEQAAAVWFRGEPDPSGVEAEEREVVEADLFALVTAFKNVLASLQEPSAFEISREEYPVEVSAEEIRGRLARGRPLPFMEMFPPGTSRGKLISIFLALLELIRSAEAKAFQEGPLGAIMIFPVQAVAEGETSRAQDLPARPAPTPDS